MNLAIALGRRGHDVHVFARRNPLGLARSPAGVALHTLDHDASGRQATPLLDSDWAPEEVEGLAERVAAVTRGASLDVLHFHYALPFVRVLDAVRDRLGADSPPLLGTLHGTDVSVLGQHPKIRRELARSLPRLDALTTVSESHAELAAQTFGLTSPPEVIPNFVDILRFRPAPKRRERRRPRVIHVSNFRAPKQPLAVARIYREVRRRCDAELWLVGDGEGMPPVRKLLAEAGVGGDTRWFGLRLDVERIIPHADVLLVTSHTESFCMVALEASACLVPVVAPRVGGLPHTVIDGHTGSLFDPGDETAAADMVARLLADPELRTRLGTAALWHAHSYSTDAIVPRYEELYERALTARAAREGRPQAKTAA
jgi:N-acetyl-alpha-D-glucosaminyl L-malate synthase BshA